MTAILSLGSNLGDRRVLLEQALGMLGPRGVAPLRVSPVVESPALLPAEAPSDWNRPFLNAAVECATDQGPTELLATLKSIETALGRRDAPRWSPRPIDLDILLYDDEQLHSEQLTIPHQGLLVRPFALAPLAAIAPGRTIPGAYGQTALAAYRRLASPLPVWMGIVNVTPDSFSDGGLHTEWSEVEATIDGMTGTGAGWIDLGAESTRPGATPLTAEQEWQRLAPILERTIGHLKRSLLRPGISVDTYHADVARRAIELGVDAVNDVGGLTDPAMIELARSSRVDWIAMHSVSIPADRGRTLATDSSAVDQVDAWLTDRLATWSRAGLDLDRIVFDPGIGFGKTPLQSLELLRGIERFVRDDLRVLVGHSRKSYMKPLGGEDSRTRDLLTVGASLDLASRGADILRVHNVEDHVTAWRGFAHVRRG